MKYIMIFLSMITGTVMAQPIVIAHRGASGYAPENTLSSFKKALEMGAPMIEFDVHRCKSGEVVVFHDTFLKNQPNKKIKDLSWAQLQTYNVGHGQKIPLLSQVFDLVDKRAIINIELKSQDSVEPVAELIKHYIEEKQWPADRFIVASFDHYRVKKFRTLLPQVKTGVIFEGNPIGLAQIATNANAQYAIMYYEWITKEFIEDAHKRGVKVYTYTVNDKVLAQEMAALGLDGIISNYPDILR